MTSLYLELRFCSRSVIPLKAYMPGKRSAHEIKPVKGGMPGLRSNNIDVSSDIRISQQ